MNTTQRKFLVEKIQAKAKQKLRELKDQKLEYPAASNFVFKAVMGDTLKLAEVKRYERNRTDGERDATRILRCNGDGLE